MTEFIDLRGVTKVYKTDKVAVTALRGIDLRIDKGEYVAIIGPSGSGKSTLMHILGCLDVPTGGKYIFNGEDVTYLSEDALAQIRNRGIGFVFQSFNLLPKSNSLYNVQLPMIYAGVEKKIRETRAQEALEAVGLRDRALHKPNELSGGEMQRVAIARAIVMKPAIILADEPTGNLDTRTGNEIMNIFEELNKQGKTIIIVTHEQSIAKRAGRIISILDGKVISDSRKN
jgi:putative ABC transport system ATP-binding protein